MARKGYAGLLMALVGVALVPAVSHAASASIMFAEAVPVFISGTGLMYLAATLGVVWVAVRVVHSLLTDRQDGQWMKLTIEGVVVSVVAFAIIPRLLAPAAALASTPDLIGPAIDMMVW